MSDTQKVNGPIPFTCTIDSGNVVTHNKSAVHKVTVTNMVLKKNKQIRQPVTLEIAGAAPVGIAIILLLSSVGRVRHC